MDVNPELKRIPMTDHKINIEDRLNKHPHFKERIEQLLKIVENSNGTLQKADDAEQRVIDELRKLGNDVLHDWALNREKQEYKKTSKNKASITGNGKKK